MLRRKKKKKIKDFLAGLLKDEKQKMFASRKKVLFADVSFKTFRFNG
jgi:hypothetical protein